MRRVLHVLAVVALIGALAACGSSDDGGSEGTTTTATPTTGDETTTTAEGAGDPDLAETPVLLYFVRGEDVAVGGFTAIGPTVGRQALEALLIGPTGENAAAGMGTQIPPDTELLDLDVADGVATVDLSEEFASGGGSLAMQLRVAQVVYTLEQFPTVDQVDFLIDGEAVDGIGGEGLPTSYTDPTVAFAEVTPAILVTSPVPGQVLSTPITVEGTSTGKGSPARGPERIVRSSCGREPRAVFASRSSSSASTPTCGARSVLFTTSRSDRASPGPFLRGMSCPAAVSMT